MRLSTRVLYATGAWALATVAATVLASIVQTQFNLYALAGLGVPVPAGVRLDVTGRDLLQFAPGFGVLTAIGFAIAFLVTALLRRRWPGRPALWYGAAGAVAVAVILVTMAAVLGLTAIAAARSTTGFAALVLAGAAGGWLFARITVVLRAAASGEPNAH